MKPTPKLLTFFLLTLSAVLLVACGDSGPTKQRAEIVTVHSEKLNDWFEARFSDELARSPMTYTYLGQKTHYDRLNDVSALALDENNALAESWLDEIKRTYDPDRLNPDTRLSYHLFIRAMEDRIATHEFADNDYVFSHLTGPQSRLPSFMMNYHRVDTAQDAQDYISRLGAFESHMGSYIDRAEAQAADGIFLPKFAYAKIRSTAANILQGQPFNEDGDSPLWADISAKIDALDIPDSEKTDLKNAARKTLMEDVGPAFANIIALTIRHEELASDDDGVWKHPDGAAYYQSRLNHYTTTDMSADDIHNIGLSEVKRIHEEMGVIQQNIGFDGSLQDFFTHLRTAPEFTLENTDAGRAQYMSDATKIIEDMKGELDNLFITKPEADIVVKRVETYREDTAFGAFYDRPKTDEQTGETSPGVYYINLKDMQDLPTYQLQALAYHEGIPGHHMQIAIAQKLDDVPSFRKNTGQTAYLEGWALYAESVPSELGLYTDPYQDFGRLSMELFRAARLVVDTGIHHKKWTRAEAVAYMMENTANAEGDIRIEVDRYIVWPGQATAYKIGMIKIQQLRDNAEETLGDVFDVREFHDVILANGSVPLDILEQLINEWVISKKT